MLLTSYRLPSFEVNDIEYYRRLLLKFTRYFANIKNLIEMSYN